MNSAPQKTPPNPFRIPLLLFLLFLPLLPSCSSYPPDEFFADDIRKMAMIEREMGFEVQVDEVRVLAQKKIEGRVEVQLEVKGWAVSPDLTIGAVLPAAPGKSPSWALWVYFCRKVEKNWVVEEKYKVDEGFFQVSEPAGPG